MQQTKKGWLVPLLIILAISLAANVYSFTRETEKGGKEKGGTTHYESELVEKKKEIETLRKELETKSTPAPEVAKADTETAVSAPETEVSGIINTAQRFIEYVFESDPETYVTRKKMALNYMTDSLYETLYSSDGVDEEQQKVAVDIKKVNVFVDSESENEAIVHYVYKEEILASGYEEEKEMYVKLSFEVEDGKLKVAEIEPLENEYGGI